MKWRRFCVVQFKTSTSLRATPGHLNFLRSVPSNSPPPPSLAFKAPRKQNFYWTIERSFEWSTNVAEFCSYIIVFDAAVGFSAYKLHSAIFLRGHLLTPADSLPLNFFIFKIKTRVFRWFKFPIPSKQLSNFPPPWLGRQLNANGRGLPAKKGGGETWSRANKWGKTGNKNN